MADCGCMQARGIRLAIGTSIIFGGVVAVVKL